MNAYAHPNNILLVIQPGDSFFPLVNAIDGARKFIKMTIFRMDDPVVRDAIARAAGRGVRVQALVAPESKGWNKRNRKLGDELTALGVEVSFPAGQKIKRHHYKLMVIDGRDSLVLTFNPTRNNLHYARDFGFHVRDEQIAAEIERLFEADWHGEQFQPAELPLVISPDNSRKRLTELLGSATRTIRIMDAKVRDKKILRLLAEKAAAGCDIKIIGPKPNIALSESLRFRRMVRYKLHAKCIVVDTTFTFVGSQNLRSPSLDQRRELGFILQDPVIARRIERTFDEDWLDAERANKPTPGDLPPAAG
ncbi:MAG TPA: phospholipase D-like domain-containing protein [Blastocatellia bacterium]|nr:phospholipase D-like domain-containing protein [Blastocatellia bacterium]